MKSIKGKLSYRCYDGVPMPDMDLLKAQLANGEFKTLSEESIIDTIFGWVNPKQPFLPIADSDIIDWKVGSYLVFAYRIDQVKYDKAKFDIMLAKAVKESGYTHVSTDMKREMADKIKRELRKKNQPRTKIVEAFYDMVTKKLVVLSKSTTDSMYIEKLWEVSFGIQAAAKLCFKEYITEFLLGEQPAIGFGQLGPKQFLMSVYSECNANDLNWATEGHVGLLISDDSIKLSGLVEGQGGNMGNTYTVKSCAGVNEDAVVNQLIEHNAAAIDELKFTMTAGQLDIDFCVKEDSLVPYGIDLPPTPFDGDDKIEHRFDILLLVDEVWRQIITRFRHIKTEKAEDNF